MPRRSSIERADHLTGAVRRLINEADIEGLFRMGAPADEYEHEIGMIAARLLNLRPMSAAAVEDVLMAVWREQFDPLVSDSEDVYKQAFGPIAARLVADVARG